MSSPVAGHSRRRKVKVLFFAADPLSAPPHGTDPRLLLIEEIRQISEKVREAKYRNRLKFEFRLATRTDDVYQALLETKPDIVHFSGHGTTEGLVFQGKDGNPHYVDADALARLFEAFRGDIQLVVFNACYSSSQAEAIVSSVDCAIGTDKGIYDHGAVAFAGALYSAIAFGESVDGAFRKARAFLGVERIPQEQHPHLVPRPGVDPARLFLIPRDEPAPEPAKPEATPPERPEHPKPPVEPAGRGWIFPLVVWAISLVGASGLVHGFGKAFLLSLVPLGIAIIVLLVAPPERGRLITPAKGTILGLSVIALFAGAKILNNELQTARRLYAGGAYEGAFTRFKDLAEEGDSEAKGFLGIMYMSPRGTAEDDSAGFYWLSEAAQDGDPRGMYALGIAYETGEGVKADARQALHWYALAARKEHPEAMNKIGELYRRGPAGITRSDDSAMVWYGRAANAGSIDGMSNLALTYEVGLTGPPNLDEALRWHRRAADAGSTRAMVDLAWVHERGIGVRANADSAAYWLTRAAEARDEFGMNNLGVLYARGSTAVPKDCAQARAWIQQAADKKLPEAVENLPRLRGCGS